MPKITPQEAAQKWAARTAAATADVARGIDRVTQAPGAKAAAAADKWHQRVTQAKDKFQRNTAAVSLSAWQEAAKAGTARIASGVQAKVGKMEAFQTDFFAHLERGRAAIEAMPTATIDQAIAKATAQMRHNAAFRRQPRG